MSLFEKIFTCDINLQNDHLCVVRIFNYYAKTKQPG